MRKGIIYAFTAYGLWGFFPIYFKWLHDVPALQILAHRIVWSVLLLVIVLTVRHEFERMRSMLTWRIVFSNAVAGVLLALNWGTYIYAVNAGYILEASLGYFINPLVSVLLGVIFLRESLKSWQWISIAIAAAGVVYITVAYGRLPWLSLTLAASFGMYGLMKKIAPLNALHGLTIETSAIFIPALAFLLFSEFSGVGAFGHTGWLQALLMALAGIITVIPLLFFAVAAQQIPLSTLGLIQYLTPTMQFLLGVFLYHEDVSPQRIIGFSMIWAALAFYTLNTLARSRRRPQLAG